MKRFKSLALALLVSVVGLSALVFGPGIVVVRFVHHECPGGSLTLAGDSPMSLEPGTGSQHFMRQIYADSGVALTCASPDGAVRRQMEYVTPGKHHHVDLEVDGCNVKKVTVSRFL